MAPVSVRSTNQRSHSPIFGRPPVITYTRRMKPIPLQGRQFRRDRPYDLPPDSDDESAASPRRPKTSSVQQPDPDDSPLSDDELEAVYGNKRRHVKHKAARTNVLKSSRSMPRENAEQQTAVKKRATQAPEGRQITSKQHTQNQTRPRSKLVHRTSHVMQPPRERLPVNELIMTRSSPENDIDEPLSEAPAVEERDPISDITQHTATRDALAVAQKADDKIGEPVLSTRKRVKSTKFTHKSVLALRKKKQTNKESKIQSGDGFETTELAIVRGLQAGKKYKKSKPLLLGFSALTLQAGPLPDVKFDIPSSQLQLQAIDQKQEADARNELVAEANEERDAEVDDERSTIVNNDHGDFHTGGAPIIDPATTQAKIRRVSFNDQVRRQRISQQLSSISAPRRIYSISSDGNNGDHEDFDPTDDEGEVGDLEQHEDKTSHYSFVEEDDADDELNLQSEEAVPVPPSNQQARRRSSYWSRASSPTTPAPTKKNGINLDFRKAMPPGLALPPTLGKRRLIEVSDAIHDEQDRFLEPLHSPSHVADDEMLDDEPPQHPMSILKNHTIHQQDIDTHPSATAANTRRNSMIMLDEDSSYFATSMNMLQQSADHPKAPILKHRSSQLRRSTSYYKQDQDLQPSPESPDYSNPNQPDYTNSNQLDVLKRSGDAVWTSSRGATTAPRDLGALTRSVSKEYGTMSQSVRRRSSHLPFQSPTKGQRA